MNMADMALCVFWDQVMKGKAGFALLLTFEVLSH